ncbi:MAG: hypothetical protein OJF49_002213 [Ktedonobacterales bacterium]|jgi:hypothetical protein|nr:MAG: hypothetical protein OJF49_002213 [Ktedonobacterales bacterium]
MPTHEEFTQFLREFAALTPAQRAQFLDALHKMISDLQAKAPFRHSLRIKGVQSHPGIFEMTWAPDGRATFHYGAEVQQGEAHIVWRRIGDHSILKNP